MGTPRIPWKKVLTEDLLVEAGRESSSLQELADALAARTGYPVTKDALFNGYKRNHSSLGLPSSVTSFFRAKGTSPPRLAEVRFPLSDDRRERLEKARRWIITAAVNNTDADGRAWNTIKAYAQKHDAEIVVMPVRYRNPTDQREGARDYEYWWDPRLQPYLCDELIELHPEFQVAAHIRIQATAVNPLQGLKTITRGISAVFPHTQLAMETVAVPQQREAKVLTTSMAITEPYYSTTKAGAKGQFHHSTGAVVIESDGERAYMRHLICDEEGGFHDVAGGELRYYHGAHSRKATAAALVVSDEHQPFTDRWAEEATYTGPTSISKVVKPEYIVRHDVVDMYAVNPHERNSAIKKVAGAKLGFNNLADELQAGADYVNRTTDRGQINVFPWSNHPNEHLLNWLDKVHAPRDDPHNAEVWLELWLDIVRSIEPTSSGYTHNDPFTTWMGRKVQNPAYFLEPDQSFTVAGVELGFHGHHGPNGARGTRRNMSTIGVRSVIGHGHSPGIHHGCWQTGVMAHDLGYAKGPSAWACCQIVVYPNGKRQALFVNRSGKWFA